MNLDRLELFLKVVDVGTVTGAAKQVHLTQPALSRNLKLLEEEFGAALFKRQGRRLVLTSAGRSLVPQARALLAQWHTARRAVDRVATRRYFDLKLGTVDSVATYLLPHLIGPLREAWPELEIKLYTGRTGDLLTQLGHDQMDVAIVAGKGDFGEQRAHKVGPYLRRYWGHGERFSDLREATTEAEVQQFPIIELEALPGQPTMIPEDATSFAVSRSLASVKALVLGGFGVGALLDFMLTADERALLVSANVPPEPDCHLYVVGAPGRDSKEALGIEDTVAQVLRKRLSETTPTASGGHRDSTAL